MRSQDHKARIGVFLGAWLVFFLEPSASAQQVTTNPAVEAASAAAVQPPGLAADGDETVPPVDRGPACSLHEIVEQAEARILEFVRDVDRFTATESLTHESINKHGSASARETRKFDYVVSIEEVRPGHLGVTEYRNGGAGLGQFPNGIVTSGLPALVLIFHPYYAPNYEMTCEGLTRSNGLPAWQVHFRQRPDKPNELKTYQLGSRGASYEVGLEGRAWISAESYQIVRMETDLVAPRPEIQLLAEHTAIEYAAVRFRESGVNLWLPQSAEVYLAWRGRKMRRRHSFDHYLLFRVDDRQRLTVPKS